MSLTATAIGALLVGLGLGVAVGILLRRVREAELQAQVARVPELQAKLDEAAAEIRAATGREAALQADLRGLEVRYEQLQQDAEKRRLEFEHTAQQVLDDKRKSFDEQSRKLLGELLNPLKEQIGDFRKKIETVHHEDAKQQATLMEQIRQLSTLNQQMRDDAQNLTKALKGDSKMRGNWGEMILERVLEASGLQKGREYEREVYLKDDDGKGYRPDAVIRLPEKKDVVVDAKVSLVAYERYQDADLGDAEREQALKTHLQSVRQHLRSLSEKRYDHLDGVRSLDMILMFVPIEPALLLAWEHDPDLFSEAFEKRVFLVSPSTMFAVLRVVQNLWRYDDQNQNAVAIADRAGKLYDKFAGFVESLDGVGRYLDQALSSFTQARRQLSEGPGNVLRQVEMLKDLGANTSKQLPGVEHSDMLTDAAEDDEV